MHFEFFMLAKLSKQIDRVIIGMITFEAIRYSYTHGKLIKPSGFRICISNATKLCICNAHLGFVNKSIFISAGDSGLLISAHTHTFRMDECYNYAMAMQKQNAAKLCIEWEKHAKNEDGGQILV